MSCDKYLSGFLKKGLSPVASNACFGVGDFLLVLVSAARTNGFLEGVCRWVPGACDAETLFDRLVDVPPEQLVEVFSQDVFRQLDFHRRRCRGRRMVLAADITYDAYYGSHPNEWVHHQIFHKGASGSFQYLTLSVVVGGRRDVVGIVPLRRGDDKKNVLEQLLDCIKHHVQIECLLLDRGFNSVEVIDMLKQRRIHFLMLWRKAKWIRSVFQGMGRCKWLRQRHSIGDVSFTLVFVKGLRFAGDTKTYDWVFATNLRQEKPSRYVYLYRRRWGIETVFRVTDELWIRTKTTHMGKRFFLVLVAVYLYNHWQTVISDTNWSLTFTEYASHLQTAIEQIHPSKPPTTKQQQIQEYLATTLN